MLVLGIETSCDETAAAVVEDGRNLLSNVVASQVDFHKVFGGVVPEIASRKHLEAIIPIVEEALNKANLKIRDVDLLAVTKGPGLPGSLVVGVVCAKTLALAFKKPLVGVSHIQAHIYANFLIYPDILLPAVCLVVSGGHTDLFILNEDKSVKHLGRTRDDAAGEAFDKVAKLLNLGYPGGPIIDRLAREGDANFINFPRPLLPDSWDFSFSGLKTAVLREVKRLQGEGEIPIPHLCASFQEAVVDTLVEKTSIACKEFSINRVLLGGGVVANSRLREKFAARAEEEDWLLYFPPLYLCTDNAAMVATLGYHDFLRKG
ncbi:MAG: tRNA (adenosine(37)-N6)-threonylcarbamoyltransferase complex transferase subunit TsaD, partial [bacterium]